MDQALIGKWIEAEGQAYPGLSFEFHPDGSYDADYDDMGVTSGGPYEARGREIDIDQTRHNFGLVGKFAGLYQIDGDELRMVLAAVGDHPRPADLTGAVLYRKAKE